MTQISLPYTLKERTKAYAAKVMGNLNAIKAKIDSLNITGLTAGDLESVLAQLLALMVKINETGNADDIVFDDAETLQDKYDTGLASLGVLTAAGGYYFHVDTNGHLLVSGNENLSATDFTLDTTPASPTFGHLLYTVPDPETGTGVVTIDIGNVRGATGATGAGDMAAATYDPNGLEKDLNTYTVYVIAYAASWVDSEQEIDSEDLSGLMTATCCFDIGVSQLTGTKTERDAWSAGMPYIVSQADGSFVLGLDGTTPVVDIPLQVAIRA